MMTPAHQRILDDLLTRTHQRTVELATATNFPVGKRPEEQTIERLRESPLGQHLAAIFNYAEGYDYPYEGDVRTSAGIITRYLFGDTLSTQRYRLPSKFHRTPLGKEVHAALARFFTEQRPGQLMSMQQMREHFGVKRQTVHQWIEDGLVFAVYIDNQTHFYRKDVERLATRRTRQSAADSLTKSAMK